MKRVLFLDDDKHRTMAFRDLMRLYDIVPDCVETAAECIERLKAVEYDLISLDHDLGGETFVDSAREDCGMEVVRWLRKHQKPQGFILVHSFNMLASKRMVYSLSGGYAAFYVPFGSAQYIRKLAVIRLFFEIGRA